MCQNFGINIQSLFGYQFEISHKTWLTTNFIDSNNRRIEILFLSKSHVEPTHKHFKKHHCTDERQS